MESRHWTEPEAAAAVQLARENESWKKTEAQIRREVARKLNDAAQMLQEAARCVMSTADGGIETAEATLEAALAVSFSDAHDASPALLTSVQMEELGLVFVEAAKEAIGCSVIWGGEERAASARA
jgi:acyl-CoA reductase-like NAD-dependent aldehyde dehydrogenase